MNITVYDLAAGILGGVILGVLLVGMIRQIKLHKNPWTAELQLEVLRAQLAEDNRWLASNHIAYALTCRYIEMTALDWYKRSVKSIPTFREDLGLTPRYGPPAAPAPAEQAGL